MQDILIRYKRMQGYEALWQPGTDHAAIATEVKVIDKLKKEGIDKADLGREGFLKECLGVERRVRRHPYCKNSLKNWGLPLTGTGSASQWMKDVLRQFWKFLSNYMRKDLFTEDPNHQLVSGLSDIPLRCRGRTCKIRTDSSGTLIIR